MTLREWLDEQTAAMGRGALSRLADATNINIRSLYRYSHAERTPPLDIALRISAATGGKVRVKDLVAGAGKVRRIESNTVATVETDASPIFGRAVG